MAGILKTLTPYGRGAGHFCVGQSDYERSRETITLAITTIALPAGQLLGEVNQGGLTAVATAKAGNTGTGTMAATPTVDAGAPTGTYKLTIIEPATDAGTFEVEKPDGSQDGTGTVGVAYNGSINFTLQDATDFVAGDGFNIVVSAAASTGYGPYDPTATNGLQNFGGILWDDRPISTATQKAVRVYRDQPVNANALTGWSTLSSPQKAALTLAAKAVGIIILT